MSTIWDTLGVNTEDKELNETTTVATGGIIAPGVFKFVVDRAFVSKSSGGANKLNIDFKYMREDNTEGSYFYGTYISSGDSKNNRTYYVGKDGKQHPLPGLKEAMSAFKALGTPNPEHK